MGIVKSDLGLDARVVNPCHWGVVNGGCVVTGKPHPSNPFTKPQPTVYNTVWAAWKKKLLMDEILADENSMFTTWRGWLFITSYESICVRFWRFPKFPMEFPRGWRWRWRVPKFPIQDSWMDGGGDFIQREVFQALPKKKRSRKLGQPKNL